MTEQPPSPQWTRIVLVTWAAGLAYLASDPQAISFQGAPISAVEIARWACALLPIGVILYWKAPREQTRAHIPESSLLSICLACGAWLLALLLRLVFTGESSLMLTALPLWAAAIQLISHTEFADHLFPRSRADWIRDVILAISLAMIVVGTLSTIVMMGSAFGSAFVAAASLSDITWNLRAHLIEILLVVAVIPWLEEIIFRGALIGYLAPRTGRIAAVVISAALFSLLHMQSDIFWARGIAGLAMGFVYLRSGRIFAPFLLHALFNSGIMIVAPWLHRLS